MGTLYIAAAPASDGKFSPAEFAGDAGALAARGAAPPHETPEKLVLCGTGGSNIVTAS